MAGEETGSRALALEVLAVPNDGFMSDQPTNATIVGTDEVFIVDQQGQAACTDHFDRIAARLGIGERSGADRQPQFDGGARAHSAFYLQGTTQLCGKAVRHRKAKPGSPADALGREKRLNGSCQGSIVHAHPRVGK